MRLPRWFRRWRQRQREAMRVPRLSRLWRQCTTPLRNGWAWLNEARSKRSLRNLWWGLPAVVMGVAAVLVGTVAQLRGADAEADYLRLAIQSHQAGDYDKARIYLERVYRSGDSTPEIRFLLAGTLEGQGENRRARALLEELSPETGPPGYPRAHLLKARWLLSPDQLRSDDEIRRALRHLSAAEQQFADDAEWLRLAAKFHLMTGDNDTAVRYLRLATRKDPALWFDLAMVSSKLELSEAGPDLQHAREHFEETLVRKARDKTARLNLARILTEQGDFSAAFDVLSTGLALQPNGPFGKAIAQVCLAHYDQLLASEDTRPEARLALLQKAIKHDPRSPEAVRRLAFFGEEAGSTEQTKRDAREYLEAMIAAGQHNPLAHLALGTKAWQDGHGDVAVFHLKRAYQQDESMAVLANNLAWVLAHQKEPELEQALSIINTVLEDHPRVPNFRDTRGQILVKLERWPEALDDLEFALRSMPESAGLHRALSKVYKRTDPPMPGLAAKHAKLANTLQQHDLETGLSGK